MGDLATLPTFQPAPTGYTHTEFNAIFAALTIATAAVTTNKIADDAVTFAKIQNVATNTLLGRSTAGTGDVESITPGAGLALSAGGLSVGWLDTNSSHRLRVACGSDLTADRTVTFTTGDADRTITLTGNATLNQDVSTGGNPTFAAVTATTFTGALTGNASTATALQTARNINGVAFNGTADITVTAAAGTLTGTTLNATVVTSSLTSVGALNSGSITSGFGSIDIGTDALTAGAISGVGITATQGLRATGAIPANFTSTAVYDYFTDYGRFFSFGGVGVEGGYLWYTGTGGATPTQRMGLTSSALSVSVPLSVTGLGSFSGGINANPSSTLNDTRIILYPSAYGLGMDGTDAVIFANTGGGGVSIKDSSVSGTLVARFRNSGTTLNTGLTLSGGYSMYGPDATASILFRYNGGTNNPGLFVRADEAGNSATLYASGSAGGTTLRLGVDGSPGVVQIVSAGAQITGGIGVGNSPSASFAFKSTQTTGITPFWFKTGAGGEWQFGTNAGSGTGDDIVGLYSATWGPSNSFKPLMLWNSAGSITTNVPVTVTGALTVSSTVTLSSLGAGFVRSNGSGVLSTVADPNADRLIFWDDSAGSVEYLTLGTNLSITGTTINAAGGGAGIGGSSGATDNAIIRADGTGGATVQASAVSIDDSGNVTGATTYDCGTGGYKVSGTKVVGAQAAAEADIALTTSGFTSDAATHGSNYGTLNGKINSLLGKLRTHGLIAT
jgi:hypothetical protein